LFLRGRVDWLNYEDKLKRKSKIKMFKLIKLGITVFLLVVAGATFMVFWRWGDAIVSKIGFQEELNYLRSQITAWSQGLDSEEKGRRFDISKKEYQVMVRAESQLSGGRDLVFDGSIEEVLSLVNESRASLELPALNLNENLNQSALWKARDMKERGYFEHISPEGVDYWFFVKKSQYDYQKVGENLAEGYFSASEVHQAWMESEGHRDNILSTDFEEIGIAILESEFDGQRTYLIVQHFGEPIELEKSITVVCKEDLRESCENLKEEQEKVKEVFQKQEKEIERALGEGFSEKDLRDLYENLSHLEEVLEKIEEDLAECKSYQERCDQWE
jgi:hypothetical protein